MAKRVSWLPNLYALRFILASFVVIYHVPQISNTVNFPYYREAAFLNKGTLAVYYFFTLSGFLIIRLIYLEILNSGSFNFKQFYLRRIQRLYPVYYLVLFTGLMIYHIILPLFNIPFDTNYKIWELIISYIFLIPNVINEIYPDIGGILKISWSIGVEEQFYLFIPIIVFLLRKNIKVTLAATFVILILILIVFPAFYQFKNFYFYFLSGGLMAISFGNKPNKILNNIFFQSIFYLLFVLSFFTNFFEFDSEVIYHLFNVVVSASLITILAYFPKFEIKSRYLNYFGKISYGIYMYHMIVIAALLQVLQMLEIDQLVSSLTAILIMQLTTLLLTIVLSSISYEFFEKRFYAPKN